MPPFEIVLKNPKIKSYRFIALLIVILNLAVFVFLLFADVDFYEAAASLFMVSGYCLYRFYLSKKNGIGFFMDEFSLFFLAGSWVALHHYLIAFGCVLTGILYALSLQELRFVVELEGIRRTNFPERYYTWDVLTNVMIRDKMLTLDFRNNRLIQQEIENDVDEKQFNGFSRQCLGRYSNAEMSTNLN